MVFNDLIDVSKKNGADEILLYNELEELENDYFEVLEIAEELKC